MRKDSKALLVIPVRNERSLKEIILSSLLFADKVLVIDSSDKPCLNSEDFKNEKIIIKRYSVLGKGNAIRFSLKIVRKMRPKYVIFMDANERDPRDIKKILKKLEEGFDMVVGVRKSMRSLQRKFLNWFGRVCYKIFTGNKLSDVFSGFFGFRWELLRKMKLEAKRFEIEINFLLEAWKLKASIAEVQIKVPKLQKSKCTKKDIVRISLFFDKWFIKNRREYQWAHKTSNIFVPPLLMFPYILQKALLF